MNRVLVPVVLVTLTFVHSCGKSTPPVDPEYRAEVEAAWAEREARLTAADGWLTLVGLHWLSPGVNTVGSAIDAAVCLPDATPPAVGTLVLGDDGAVTLVPDQGAGLTVNGEPAAEGRLATDANGAPDLLRAGRILFYLIERGDRVGVRVKDPEADARREFSGIEHFPVSEAYRVVATLELYDKLKEVEIPTVIGTPSVMWAPGLLHFEIDGNDLTLEPYLSGPDDPDLFLVFRDGTSGDTTYGAGRFLYARLGEQPAVVTLDFNLAVNPPCAFTPYATCPLPTPENSLPVPIEAGERFAGEHH